MDTASVLVTLVLYKLALVAIGLYARERSRDESGFFLGGRGLGPWVAAISASASSSSAWTLLGVSGAAYAWGLSSLWLFPACVGGFLLNWALLAPGLRRVTRETGALTATEALQPERGHPLRSAVGWTASLIILFSLVTYVASQFQGAGKAFQETFGMPAATSILLGGGIVVLYTMLGGFWAVSLTDTLQGLLMAATAVVLPAAALSAAGGPAGLMEGLRAVDAPGYLSLTRAMAPAAAFGFVFGLLGIGLGYPGQPHVVNRFMALAGGEAELRRARRIAVGWAVLVYAGMILLGLCGRVLFGGLGDREVVFVAAANRLFHPAVSGVMLAAVLSAIMSTADSQLLVAASTVTHDLGLGKGLAKDLVLRSRIVIAILSAAAAALALYAPATIFSRVLFAWTAMGSAFGPLLLTTALKGPVPPKATLVSMGLGFTLSVAAYLFEPTKGTAFERVLPFLVALAAAWPAATCQRARPSD